MNFSTTPPNDSISRRTRWWYGVSTARTSSGSSRSAREVKPTRSTKITVTIRRSIPAASSVATDAPHNRQNRATSGFSAPQVRHCRMCQPYGGERRSDVPSCAASWQPRLRDGRRRLARAVVARHHLEEVVALQAHTGRTFVAAVTVAVRGTSRSRAISPK